MIGHAYDDYFNHLFNNHRFLTPPNSSLVNIIIHNDMKEALIQPISDKEIYDALLQIHGDKTPDIYEFTAKIFKSNSELLGKQFLVVAHYFFNSKRLPPCSSMHLLF